MSIKRKRYYCSSCDTCTERKSGCMCPEGMAEYHSFKRLVVFAVLVILGLMLPYIMNAVLSP